MWRMRFLETVTVVRERFAKGKTAGNPTDDNMQVN